MERDERVMYRPFWLTSVCRADLQGMLAQADIACVEPLFLSGFVAFAHL